MDSYRDSWEAWTTIGANVATMIGFVAGGFGAVYAGRKYFNERTHERLVHLYSLANDLFRAEMTAQHLQRNGRAVDPTPIREARAALKNWYYDNRFLFAKDADLKALIEAADDEGDSFLRTLDMAALLRLRTHLESQLPKAP